MKVKGWVRRGDKGPVLTGIPGVYKLAVPDRRSGIGNDLAGHEVIVTGVVRDTRPDDEHRGVVFLSCRHVPAECETCRRKVEEAAEAAKRREENLRREALRREIIKRYGLASFVVGNPDMDCPKAYNVLRSVESIDDPRLPIISHIAAKYGEWAKVQHQVHVIEEQVAKMQHAPGLEDTWRKYCELGDKRDSRSLEIWAKENKLHELKKELRSYVARETFSGPAKGERTLREWRPSGAAEHIQRLELGSSAECIARDDDDAPFCAVYRYSPHDRGEWYWKTIETREVDPSWAAEKKAEYEEQCRRVKEAEEELQRMKNDPEFLQLQAEVAAIAEELIKAREAYKAELLGNLPSRAEQLWKEMKELEAKL